jgi:tetratricopeptide (TPR) repeat protein
LGGGGKIVEAGQDLNKFVTSNPNNYHFYTATEMIADIQLKLANYDEAQKKYSELESAPFPEYKMRAGVGKGRVLVAEKKFSEAQSEFEKVRAITSVKGKAAEKQQFAAQLGIALCQANQGKVDEAIAMIEGVIKGVDPEDTDLMAQAYVTLGRCYLLKSDAKKQALLAFLHVDQLYSGQPAAHAEALKNLDILWRDLGKPERALQAVQMLKDRYSAAGP